MDPRATLFRLMCCSLHCPTFCDPSPILKACLRSIPPQLPLQNAWESELDTQSRELGHMVGSMRKLGKLLSVVVTDQTP